RTTIIFQPSVAFDLDETVTVLLNATLPDRSPVRDSFSFQTVRVAPGTQYIAPDGFALAFGAGKPAAAGKFSGDQTLSTLGPMVDSVFSRNPTPGKVYISISGGDSSLAGLSILDENANLLHFVAIKTMVWDFLMQPNGEMTYYGVGLDEGKYYGLDSSFHVVDSFGCANGYTPDAHELLVNKGGGYTILGATLSYADLSSVGGSSNAEVQGNVIQTFDAGGNLIFQWRGIDYYNPKDALGVNFRATPVDFEHANSIDIDSEGNYMLSNRHLSEVTKINGRTGNIIWRFGGKHNEFTSLNDTIGISYQHCARFLPNNHILLFDNGNLHTVAVSRAVEFALNTMSMTDSVVWQFHHSPEIFTTAMGSVQRLPNGNTFIGWGAQLGLGRTSPTAGATEVRPDGTVVSDWSFLPLVFSYRALKFPTPAIIVTSPAVGDSLLVGTTHAITFSVSGPVNDSFVTIQYSTDGMVTWMPAITIRYNQTTYNWPIPNAPSTKAFVRVLDANGVIGVSKMFSILDSGRINVTSPMANESLLAGTTHSISFSASGLVNESSFTLEYSTDNMGTWHSITTLSNQTSYNWLIPETPSTTAFVRVTAANGVVGVSKKFSILDSGTVTDSGRITVTSPAANESLLVGTTHSIAFSVSGYVGESSITLEYSTDNRVTWNPITTLSNQTSYNWRIPNTPSTTACVRVTDANGVVGLSGMFSIIDLGRLTVTSPRANDSLLVGTTQAIAFSANGPVSESSITLEFSTDNMLTWNPITTLSNKTSYNWLIPETPSTTAVVRVTNAKGVTGVSGMFSILDSGRVSNVTVGGAPELPSGIPETIRWDVTGYTGESLNIDLLDAASGISTPIADGLGAGITSYEWTTVPTISQSTYLIRVKYASGAMGTSSPFIIAQASGVTPDAQSKATFLAPNPFSMSSTLRFSLEANADVTLVVRDLLGREMLQIPEGALEAGNHEITIDGSKLAVGPYEYQLLAGSENFFGKLTIVR
ncbi:MAG: arylsulfotransferase family protein, partial [Candidatus Kapaibacterium sp.]